MILRAIELTHVGPFRATMRLGPFATGLNVLCAPNETGKSTALRATARGLFDKHTTRGEELKALQPAGTDLAPRVVVEFETRAGRFRSEKTFLQSPRSRLLEWQGGAWQPVAEADAADLRLQDLLQSSLPGRGATRPEHWGLLGFLWARQGEPSDWPSLADEGVGRQIRARLARLELDPVVEKLSARLATMADSIVTATGQARAGGPLRQADDDLTAIEAELGVLRATRAELDALHQRFQQAVSSVTQLEKEHAERAVAVKQLNEQTLAAERLRGELETRQVEFTAAQQRLTAIAADVTTLGLRQSERLQTRSTLEQATAAVQTAEARLAALREQLDRQHAARPQLEARVAEVRAALQRTQGLLRLRQLHASAGTLAQQTLRAEAAGAEVERLAALKAKLPAVTPAHLRRIEEVTELVRTQQAQVQALGVTVELTPERETSATIHEGATPASVPLPAGRATRLQRPQSLDLTLAGWGRVTLRSGAKEAQALLHELTASEAALRAALQEAGVVSLEAGREASARRKELDTQLRAAETALSEPLGEHKTLAALRTAAAHAAHRAEPLRASLQPTATEQEFTATALESDEAQHVAALPAAERALVAIDQALAALRQEERRAVEQVQRTGTAAGEQRARLGTLESQVADLLARYPEGMDASKTRAQVEFTQAEARVAVTKAGLPPEFERLPERNKRAVTALQQLADALQSKRAERDGARGALETLGGQGLYSRETALEERKVEATLRRDAARAKGWAARLARDLIEHRKQAATKAVLTPLEQRLTLAFAELTGDRSREVFLDDQLQIAGIGRARDASHAFDVLSQGAREQLLLCLRIAVAQELAVDEPQVLILDDVLVNTDALRQERVLDVLTALAPNLQVIVLTCHDDRYRGVGHAVKFERVEG
ncbi:AAA family ATPase [Horticoccus sp. 23ND18S-11]|uniref:AAA family ATPase n=1 Tax=Horticoccus sp. 23ND18S-11 TaxID=3391832 RepID=UPI0039C8E9E1